MKEGYICNYCADKHGAEWPEGHIATMHIGKCMICNEKLFLSHTSDYDWPKQRELERGREF